MSSVLLRTLTRKSKFGVWKRLGTVQSELDQIEKLHGQQGKAGSDRIRQSNVC